MLTPSGEIAGHRKNSATAEYEAGPNKEEGSDSDDEPDYGHEGPVDGDDGARR